MVVSLGEAHDNWKKCYNTILKNNFGRGSKITKH